MKLALVGVAALFSVALFGQAQTAQEWKLNLAQYGLVKAGCPQYPGHLEFLDDDHLVVSAPVAFTCDKKSHWGKKPIDTKITEIDLQGHELAAIRRTDVADLVAGPIGHVTICTGDRVELLSNTLQVVRSIAISGSKPSGGCNFGGGLSSSRMAMAIWGPAKSQLSLYPGSSSDPIAQITTSKGQSVRAVADDGFVVCLEERKQCEVVGPQGVARSFAVPQLWGGSGSYIVGLVASDKLLLASFDGKRLYAETPTGEMVSMGNVAKLRPPFIDGSSAEMSAVEPRRILYRVDGCLLGDFDDCYGNLFHRFAVYDSQISRMLFRHSYASGADVRISPNGRIVMEQDGAEVHLFRLP